MAVVALYNPAGHLGDHLDNLPPPADHSACWSSMIERRNDKTVRMHKWFPLTSNHSTQSQSGMREATHPVPLIRERIVLLNFVKTKYSHRLTFDIGPWFLACASVSGRIRSQHYYFASFLSSYGPICPEIISEHYILIKHKFYCEMSLGVTKKILIEVLLKAKAGRCWHLNETKTLNSLEFYS